MQNTRFHLAINVTDLDLACEFYAPCLGCVQGRRTSSWVDFNFFGHQLSLHLGQVLPVKNTGKVAGIDVPMPHFGAILSIDAWQAVAKKLQNAHVSFVIPPTLRFAGKPGQQQTMFFFDPFGNPIELKGFFDDNEIFNQ
jgi:extradiol dioxygenase family protein